MLDVVVGAILIITAFDVRGKYTLSRAANQIRKDASLRV